MKHIPSLLLPILYTNVNYTLHYSKEHIYPKSYLTGLPKAKCDFHNIYFCSYDLNNIRSNYAFTDELDNTFVKVTDECYVSRSKKLFYPRPIDRGVIARSILYMRDRYKIKDECRCKGDDGCGTGFMNSPKDIKMLIRWNREYSPSQEEFIRHDTIAKKQGVRNKFLLCRVAKDTLTFLDFCKFL
mgnify:CR=1 FL=1|tara:strand:+ start:1350 stop:1904 length:555 start_codon:yes stop_codon:yes gene_type:complete